MKLASHNSFSYLPARRWWMKPFAWMARCQRVEIMQQLKLGVRMFDVRVRFKNGDIIICHGLMEYDKSWTSLFDFFDWMNCREDQFYIRMVLETRKPNEEQEKMFRELCKYIESAFDNVIFFGGNNRTDWSCQHPIYKFKHGLEDIDHKYSSTTSLFPEKYKWLRFIDDLCPIFYARRYNRKNRAAGTTHKWLMLDFVDIE